MPVNDLVNTRFQWMVPRADVDRIGYYDYWVDLKPLAVTESGITRIADQTVNGVAHAVYQGKLPATLADGLHEIRVRSCIPGAKVADTDCSFWLAVNFEVKQGAPLPPRPPTPTNGTFVTVTVTVTTGRP